MYHTICAARPVIADLTADIRGIPTAMMPTNRSTQTQTVEPGWRAMQCANTAWRMLSVPAKGAKSMATALKYMMLPAAWSDVFVEIKWDGKLKCMRLRLGRACGKSASRCILPARRCRISGASSITREGRWRETASLAKLDDQHAKEGKYSLGID